ncbi:MULTISPECIES: hypothetical protein [unclassified Microcoleus]|uniref:hypothetical protein n=1 Tax=unclassified Microcoleus TaxID=2642155 RepID=UPI002FD76FC8
MLTVSSPPIFGGFVVAYSACIPHFKAFVKAFATISTASIASGLAPVAKYPSATAIRNPAIPLFNCGEQSSGGYWVQTQSRSIVRALHNILQQRHTSERSPKLPPHNPSYSKINQRQPYLKNICVHPRSSALICGKKSQIQI